MAVLTNMYHKDAVDRFEFRFKAYIYRSVRICLEDSQGVAATILLCCAIDLLAKYNSGDASHFGNKRKYTQFLRDYFPPIYEPDGFYSFVRSGLLHGFNMENEYTILCKNEDWAKQAHLKVDPKRKMTIINPFVLFSDLNAAHKAYIADVRSKPTVKDAFIKVHKQFPLKQQQTRWKKLKHVK